MRIRYGGTPALSLEGVNNLRVEPRGRAGAILGLTPQGGAAKKSRRRIPKRPDTLAQPPPLVRRALGAALVVGPREEIVGVGFERTKSIAPRGWSSGKYMLAKKLP